MLTRRNVFLAAALPAFLRAAPARAGAAEAAHSFIATLGQQLVAVVNGDAPVAEKQVALEKLIDRDVDVVGVARFCLGRFWRLATPEQQKDYTALFRAVLVRNITGKVGEYKGVTMDVGKAQAREDGVVVGSTVARPNNAPNQVDWLVGTDSGSPKIIDVIAEGTSLRLTQRSDYSAFLSSHGNNIGALIDAMRNQAASAKSG
jgi:phospholipid transport system substrate-binding protein